MAQEFYDFCKANRIQQVGVAPYHPSLNGLAERAVRIFKDGLKKQSTESLTDRIARLLFEYRRMPHTTTGVSPVELVFGRQLHSRLLLVHPAVQQKVFEKQARQKSAHTTGQLTIANLVSGKKCLLECTSRMCGSQERSLGVLDPCHGELNFQMVS